MSLLDSDDDRDDVHTAYSQYGRKLVMRDSTVLMLACMRYSLWLLGFIIFITSNVLGSVFQIGALSITLLAPLGAVSLLWNAFFARILLGDVFSRYLIFGKCPSARFWQPRQADALLYDAWQRTVFGMSIGTILIAGGAVLIAIFGVVPEKTHTLEELIQLYSRPSFIVWTILQLILLVAILGAAHYTENSLEKNLEDVYIAIPTSPDLYEDEEDSGGEDEDITPPSSTTPSKATQSSTKSRKARRWSTPPSYLLHSTNDLANGEPHEEQTVVASPNQYLSQGAVAQASMPGTPNTIASAASQLHQTKSPGSRTSRHVSFGQTKYRTFGNSVASPTASSTTASEPKRGFRKSLNVSTNTIQQRFSNDKAEKLRLWLGIAYGSASGTMSGLCLLFAKTGVELLILTVVGQNQFKRWESWMIVLALLICALLQVSWY